MSLTDDVKSLALELGADLVGVAPVDRFEDSYPTFVTFSGGGHCGMCLIHCPRGTYAPQ